LSVGFNKLSVTDSTLTKTIPDLVLDLSAIAKGYGVDAVHRLLKSQGINNILVEIGGEVRCSGLNADGNPWRIGIDTPQFGIEPGTNLHSVIDVYDQALATSGDYRNYITINNRIYSHIIDPRTGFPPDNSVASVTVLASNCTDADALATAVMIMGVESGLKLIEALPDTEVMIITRLDENEYWMISSAGMNVTELLAGTN
jgi:thiamine biosynthesis lipoprotein